MISQYILIQIQTSQISEIILEWVSGIENLQPANYQRIIVQWTQFSVCFLNKQDPPAKWLRRWRPASAIGIICVGSTEISHGKPSKSQDTATKNESVGTVSICETMARPFWIFLVYLIPLWVALFLYRSRRFAYPGVYHEFLVTFFTVHALVLNVFGVASFDDWNPAFPDVSNCWGRIVYYTALTGYSYGFLVSLLYHYILSSSNSAAK